MIDLNAPFGTYALGKRAAGFLRAAQGMPVNWLGRRGALLARRGVLKSDVPVVDAQVDGLYLRLYMGDNISERKFLFMPQFFDRFERDLLRQHLKEGDIFVDVGANAGIYTFTAAALVGDAGRVLAIEPNPVVLDRLKYNMVLNNFTKRILIEQAGVSDVFGSFDLTLDDSNLGGSSLVTARSLHKITVICYPLYDIVCKYGLPRIDALKIDIEGAEDKALIPFLQRAPGHLLPRVIILENSPAEWTQDLPGALEKAGYKKLKTTRMNMVWTRP